ncbi:MAG: shikimate dehydrogenase [Firmicutes bacterium]|nr:shikimate dehydrogenase [Bacillota bacterium]
MKEEDVKIFGLLGYPLEHSISSIFFNYIFEKLKLPYGYFLFPVKPSNLSSSLNKLKAIGFAGVNVTIPHKEKIIRFLDILSPEAEAIGAVNTVIAGADGRLTGGNTDSGGFINAWKKEAGEKIQGRSFVILGAGGAARAVIYGLCKEGAGRILIFCRHFAKGLKIEKLMTEKFKKTEFKSFNINDEKLSSFLSEKAALINTTPVGMHPDTKNIPVSIRGLRKGSIVYDLIYNPEKTLLLKKAKSMGAKTFSGLTMLLEQAGLSYHLWTGRKLPDDLVREAGKFAGRFL